MCPNGTCSRVRVGKHLSDMFNIRNGLKQGDSYCFDLQLFFSLALEEFRTQHSCLQMALVSLLSSPRFVSFLPCLSLLVPVTDPDADRRPKMYKSHIFECHSTFHFCELRPVIASEQWPTSCMEFENAWSYISAALICLKAAFFKQWSADHKWSSGSALVVLLD